MGLQDDRLTVPLEARFTYGTERNIFLFNMIGAEVEKRLAVIGKRLQMVVNYDNFLLASDLADAYVTRRLPAGRVLLRRHQVHHEIASAMS